MFNGVPLTAWKPDIAGDCILGEDERSNWTAVRQIEQGWVSAFMGLEIDAREPDAIPSAVVMDGQVTELLVTAKADRFGNELRSQRPVAVSARDIIDPFFGQKEFSAEQAHTSICFSDTDGNHRAVLVSITREEMSVQPII